MKGFEKEKNSAPNPLWVKVRFYVWILITTAVLLAVLIKLNHAQYILENTVPAGISLINAVIAYIISKRDQGDQSYRDMMKKVTTWTITRFVVMAVAVILLLVSGMVEPLPFIFSFIGFYILHQVIEIAMLQRDIK